MDADKKEAGSGENYHNGRDTMEKEKYVLQLKVLEILRRYHKVQQHFHTMREWKKRWICPN